MCAAGVGYGGYRWLTESSSFEISAIEIDGCVKWDEQQARSLISGLVGQNVFLVNTTAAEQVLEEAPWVKSATVERDFPDSLTVSITEHEAVAAVDLGALYLVDQDGKTFKRADVSKNELVGLPIVTGIARKSYLANPDHAARLIGDAAEVSRRFSDGTRPKIGEVHVEGDGRYKLITFENAMFVHLTLDSSASIDARLQAFDRAWKSLSQAEREMVRTVRIPSASPADKVTVAFVGS